MEAVWYGLSVEIALGRLHLLPWLASQLLIVSDLKVVENLWGEYVVASLAVGWLG